MHTHISVHLSSCPYPFLLHTISRIMNLLETNSRGNQNHNHHPPFPQLVMYRWIMHLIWWQRSAVKHRINKQALNMARHGNPSWAQQGKPPVYGLSWCHSLRETQRSCVWRCNVKTCPPHLLLSEQHHAIIIIWCLLRLLRIQPNLPFIKELPPLSGKNGSRCVAMHLPLTSPQPFLLFRSRYNVIIVSLTCFPLMFIVNVETKPV